MTREDFERLFPYLNWNDFFEIREGCILKKEMLMNLNELHKFDQLLDRQEITALHEARQEIGKDIQKDDILNLKITIETYDPKEGIPLENLL